MDKQKFPHTLSVHILGDRGRLSWTKSWRAPHAGGKVCQHLVERRLTRNAVSDGVGVGGGAFIVDVGNGGFLESTSYISIPFCISDGVYSPSGGESLPYFNRHLSQLMFLYQKPGKVITSG